MTSGRPYRAPLHDDAIAEIELRGHAVRPDVVDAFLAALAGEITRGTTAVAA